MHKSIKPLVVVRRGDKFTLPHYSLVHLSHKYVHSVVHNMQCSSTRVYSMLQLCVCVFVRVYANMHVQTQEQSVQSGKTRPLLLAIRLSDVNDSETSTRSET